MFCLRRPTLERKIIRFVEKVPGILCGTVVLKWVERYTMERLTNDKSTLRHYKFALYATNVTFRNTICPGVNYEVQGAL